MSYAELQVTSNFSFLRGASHAKELVERATELGHKAIGITDRNTLAGVVRMHVAADLHELRLVVGVRLDFVDAPSVLAYPTDRAAYGRLSRMLSLGKRRTTKGQCLLRLTDLFDHGAESIDLLYGHCRSPSLIPAARLSPRRLPLPEVAFYIY